MTELPKLSCWHCEGRGLVPTVTREQRLAGQVTETCPTCHGTGEPEREPVMPRRAA